MSKELRIGVPGAGPGSGVPAFAVSRDSAGILIGVRDNAAPQFAVSRDSGGLLLSVLPAPVVAYTYTVPAIFLRDHYTHVRSWDYYGGTYAGARAGTQKQAWMGDPYDPFYEVGQRLADYYEVFQPYLRFDTSVIPDDETVTSAVLAMPLHGDHSDTDFIIEARVYDAGETITTGDYVAGADLAAKPLFATRDTAGGLPIYVAPDWNQVVFVEAAGAAAAINKTGITGLLLCSDRTRNDMAPAGWEYVDLSTQIGGALTITTSGPA